MVKLEPFAHGLPQLIHRPRRPAGQHRTRLQGLRRRIPGPSFLQSFVQRLHLLQGLRQHARRGLGVDVLTKFLPAEQFLQRPPESQQRIHPAQPFALQIQGLLLPGQMGAQQMPVHPFRRGQGSIIQRLHTSLPFCEQGRIPVQRRLRPRHRIRRCHRPAVG